uniref:RRM domain-containing protein n=1 Tax=Rhabditophanes sp. KR3021 TaxID=114890 RepID=A0AC35UFZ1_9BILA
MNRVSDINKIQKLNDLELKSGYSGDSTRSWHRQYKDSAWIHINGLSYDLTEGDVIAVFSQYGEVVHINLVRDHKTGKSKGFCFLCYEDQRSTVLAVDNMNGITLLKRLLKVDHVEEYKVPKYKETMDEKTRELYEEGCAPRVIKLEEKEIRRLEEKEEKRLSEVKSKLEEVSALGIAQINKDLLKEKKKIAKEEKKERKREKRLRKQEKRDEKDDANRGNPDDDNHWRTKKAKPDKHVKEEDLYKDAHFKSDKEHKFAPPPPTHNLRPDFNKAAWRDVELFKIVREQEKQVNGEKPKWKEPETYIPSRLAK